MGSNNIDDGFSELDDFLNEDMGETIDENASGDRSTAVSQIEEGMKAFKEDFQYTDKFQQAGQVIDKAIPSLIGDSLYKEATDFKRTITESYDKAKKSIGESASPLIDKMKSSENQAVKSIAETVGNYLGVKKKDSNIDRGPTEDERAQDISKGVFLNIQQPPILQQTDLSSRSDALTRYQISISEAYYRKSLELKYKHILVSDRSAKALALLVDALPKQLRNIEKNTSLPDIIKMKTSEGVMGKMKQDMSRNFIDGIVSNSTVLTRLKNKITNISGQARDSITGILDGIGLASDVSNNMGGMGSKASMAGSMGADAVRDAIGTFAGNMLSKTKVGQKAREFFAPIEEGGREYFEAKRDAVRGDGVWSSIKKSGWSAIASLFDDESVNPKIEVGSKAFNSPAIFDNRTHTTLNIVIPDLLSKIQASVQAIETGIKPNELRYDYLRDSFTDRKGIRERVRQDIFDGLRDSSLSRNTSLAIQELESASGIKLTPEERKIFGRQLVGKTRKKSFTTLDIDDKHDFFKGLDKDSKEKFLKIFKLATTNKNGEQDYDSVFNLDKRIKDINRSQPMPIQLIQKYMETGHAEELVKLGIINFDKKTRDYTLNKDYYNNMSADMVGNIIGNRSSEQSANDREFDKNKKSITEKIINLGKQGKEAIQDIDINKGIDKLKTTIQTEVQKLDIDPGNMSKEDRERLVKDVKTNVTMAISEVEKRVKVKKARSLFQKLRKVTMDTISSLSRKILSYKDEVDDIDLDNTIADIMPSIKKKDRVITNSLIKDVYAKIKNRYYSFKRKSKRSSPIEISKEADKTVDYIYNLTEKAKNRFSTKDSVGSAVKNTLTNISSKFIRLINSIAINANGYDPDDIEVPDKINHKDLLSKASGKKHTLADDEREQTSILKRLTEYAKSIVESTKKKKVEADRDGNGFRDNSWRDILSRRNKKDNEDNKESQSNDKKSVIDKGILGLLASGVFAGLKGLFSVNFLKPFDLLAKVMKLTGNSIAKGVWNLAKLLNPLTVISATLTGISGASKIIKSGVLVSSKILSGIGWVLEKTLPLLLGKKMGDFLSGKNWRDARAAGKSSLLSRAFKALKGKPGKAAAIAGAAYGLYEYGGDAWDWVKDKFHHTHTSHPSIDNHTSHKDITYELNKFTAYTIDQQVTNPDMTIPLKSGHGLVDKNRVNKELAEQQVNINDTSYSGVQTTGLMLAGAGSLKLAHKTFKDRDTERADKLTRTLSSKITKVKEAENIAKTASKKGLGKLGSKLLGKGLKKVPIMGSALSIYDASKALVAGHYKEAGVQALEAIVNLLPLGFLATTAYDVYDAVTAKDISNPNANNQINNRQISGPKSIQDSTSYKSYIAHGITPKSGKHWKALPDTIIPQDAIDGKDELCGIPVLWYKAPKKAREIMNYESFDNGKPDYLIVHNTAGSKLSFGRFYSKGYGAHIYIDRDGTIHKFGKLSYRYAHVGKRLPKYRNIVSNNNAIGIEMVSAYYKDTKKWQPYTKAQIESLKKVAGCITSKFGIDKQHVFAHIQVSPKTAGEGMEALHIVQDILDRGSYKLKNIDTVDAGNTAKLGETNPNIRHSSNTHPQTVNPASATTISGGNYIKHSRAMFMPMEVSKDDMEHISKYYTSKKGADIGRLEPFTKKAFTGLAKTWYTDTGKKLEVKYGYRSPSKNSKVGGAKHSFHMKGMAIDIIHTNLTDEEVKYLILLAGRYGFRGYGYGPTTLHIDTRDYNASWTYTANGTKPGVPSKFADTVAKAQRLASSVKKTGKPTSELVSPSKSKLSTRVGESSGPNNSNYNKAKSMGKKVLNFVQEAAKGAIAALFAFFGIDIEHKSAKKSGQTTAETINNEIGFDPSQVKATVNSSIPLANGSKTNFTISRGEKLILEAIAKYESKEGPDGYNYTFGNGKYIPKTVTLTDKSVADIYKIQIKLSNLTKGTNMPTSAVGKYQFTQATLKEMVKQTGIDPRAQFSATTQDFLIVKRLISKRGLNRWEDGLLSDKDFIHNLSKEFASIEDPYKGTGYYGGQTARNSYSRMLKVLQEAKRLLDVPDASNDSEEVVVTNKSKTITGLHNNSATVKDNSIGNKLGATMEKKKGELSNNGISKNDIGSKPKLNKDSEDIAPIRIGKHTAKANQQEVINKTVKTAQHIKVDAPNVNVAIPDTVTADVKGPLLDKTDTTNKLLEGILNSIDKLPSSRSGQELTTPLHQQHSKTHVRDTNVMTMDTRDLKRKKETHY